MYPDATGKPAGSTPYTEDGVWDWADLPAQIASGEVWVKSVVGGVNNSLPDWYPLADLMALVNQNPPPPPMQDVMRRTKRPKKKR